MPSRDLRVMLLGEDRTGRAFSGAASNAEKLGKKMDGVGRGIRLAMGAAAAGIAAVGAGQVIKGSIDAASDLSEAGNKVSTIFGDAAGEINKFAEGGAKTLGQSQLAVLDAASTFGVYGKAAGLAGKDNAKFAKQFSGLSADLASFYNTSPEEAVEAIGSALRGEAEPLRKYGVLLDDASMRQEALRLGLIKNTKTALTPQQKVLAAQAVIMKQTKVAQGDFAKTSGGLANQQRILAAQLENTKAKIGAKLLPVMTRLANFANEKLIPAASKIGARFQELAEKYAPKVSDFFTRKLLPVLRTVAEYVREEVLPVIRRFADWWVDHVLPAIGKVVKSLREGLTKAFETIKKKIDDNRPQLDKLRETFQKVATFVVDHVVPALGEVAEFLAKTLGEAIGIAIEVIAGVVTAVEAIGDAFTAIKSAAQTAIRFVVDKFLGLVEVIVTGAAKAFGWVPDLGPKLKTAAEDFRKFRDEVNAALGGVNNDPIHVDFKVRGLDWERLNKLYDEGILAPSTARQQVPSPAPGPTVAPSNPGVTRPGGKNIPESTGGSTYSVTVNAQTNADPVEIGREVGWQVRLAG